MSGETPTVIITTSPTCSSARSSMSGSRSPGCGAWARACHGRTRSTMQEEAPTWSLVGTCASDRCTVSLPWSRWRTTAGPCHCVLPSTAMVPGASTSAGIGSSSPISDCDAASKARHPRRDCAASLQRMIVPSRSVTMTASPSASSVATVRSITSGNMDCTWPPPVDSESVSRSVVTIESGMRGCVRRGGSCSAAYGRVCRRG